MQTQIHKRILSFIVLVSIVLIAATQLRTTLITTRDYIDNYSKDEKVTFSAYAKTLSDAYKGVLGFESDIPITNRGEYINLNGLMANAMGQKFMNNTFKLNNNILMRADQAVERDLENSTNQIIKLYNEQTRRGGEFLMVFAPTQTNPYENLMPTGYEEMDFQHKNVDYVISSLDQAGVPYLDIRALMNEQGLKSEDIMLTADHHWTPLGGFWAYGEIVKFLTCDNQSINQAINQSINQYRQL